MSMFSSEECIIIDNEGRAWLNKVKPDGNVVSSYIGFIDRWELQRLCERTGMVLHEVHPEAPKLQNRRRDYHKAVVL